MSKLCKKTGFIHKLQTILENEQLADIIRWSSCGNSFLIMSVSLFESAVLGRYFRHKRMSSFIRQLNMYGFHKQRSERDPLQFHHPLFKRDNAQAFNLIERKKTSQVTFKENLVQDDSKENEPDNHIKIKYIPSINNIEPEEEQHLGESFRLIGSKMTIRLTQGLTSLGKVELDEQLPSNEEVNRAPYEDRERLEWRSTSHNYENMIISLGEEQQVIFI